MATEVIMPKLGLTMIEGKIVKWLKKEGDPVKKGEPIVEITTEKIANVVESPETGVLLKILVQAGNTVPVLTRIAWVGQPGEKIEEAEAAAGAPASSAADGEPPRSATAEGKTPIGTTGEPLNEKTAEAEETSLRSLRSRQRVSPAARKLAEEHGIDVDSLKGTGPGGRVVTEDVQRAIEERKARGVTTEPSPAPAKETAPRAPAPAAPLTRTVAEVAGGVPYVIEPLSEMRRIIAERMYQSLASTAQSTLTAEVDVTDLVRLRESLLHKVEVAHGVRLSPTDFIVKAAALALSAHPNVNVSFTGAEIVKKTEINIGVAVDLGQGLIVPVVRNADKKGVVAISKEIKSLVEKARNGRLSPDDVTGGTFTVSNLGMFGVDAFTPVLNPPESAILGVGRIVKKPVYVGEDLLPRHVMVLSLTTDHRVIDGAPAARFLLTLRELLEDPEMLLLS
ncbi:MAG TPA: 2-oxo acid dehydrogenase subunit E2 [Clostridia bacterium]|nr:2-oxo acid dehydrogenase subunit E2 [Clostridia bacterium]